jgi:lipoate-protein ligase A
MAESFQETFDLELLAGAGLTHEEEMRAEELCAEQYAGEDWNTRF